MRSSPPGWIAKKTSQFYACNNKNDTSPKKRGNISIKTVLCIFTYSHIFIGFKKNHRLLCLFEKRTTKKPQKNFIYATYYVEKEFE